MTPTKFNILLKCHNFQMTKGNKSHYKKYSLSKSIPENNKNKNLKMC